MNDGREFSAWPTSWVRIMILLLFLLVAATAALYCPMQQKGAPLGRDYGGDRPVPSPGPDAGS